MDRKYGVDQRNEIKKIKSELICKIENIYLDTFQELDKKGLGAGAIAKLTQSLLISRDKAISSLRNAEEDN